MKPITPERGFQVAQDGIAELAQQLSYVDLADGFVVDWDGAISSPDVLLTKRPQATSTRRVTSTMKVAAENDASQTRDPRVARERTPPLLICPR